jgi:hypothetical protein
MHVHLTKFDHTIVDHVMTLRIFMGEKLENTFI